MNEQLPTLLEEYALTDLQKKFVWNYVTLGCSPERAAKLAGYSDGAARTVHYRLLQNALVLKGIQELTLHHISTRAPKAVSVVEELMRNARSERVRLEAAADLLDRAGFKPPERVNHQVDASLTVNLDIGVKSTSESPSEVIEHEDLSKTDIGTSNSDKEGGVKTAE